MILQPRKFKYKTRQKLRRAKIKKNSTLSYGTSGLLLNQPFRISAKKIFRLKLFLKRSSRKSDITKRSFWTPVFPHLPLSKKPKGMRMGKGVGKLATWHTQIRGGTLLVEFKNLRLGRAIYFSSQLRHKVPVSTTYTSVRSRHLKVNSASHLNVFLVPFW